MNRDFNYVSLFSGIGGFDLALDNLGGKCVMASEIDKWANKSFELLYGFPTAGDVTKVKEEDVPDHDVLVGGFPCFAKGTLITTNEGLKKIEEVKKGDYVLTHKNRYRKVVIPMRKEKKGIYYLKVQGSPKTKVTEEHPIYVREIKKENGEDVFGKPKWVEVKDLNKKGKYYVGITSNKERENNRELDKEDLWLLGRYLADGYVQDSKRKGRKNSYNRKVILCVGSHKIEEFKESVGNKYHITYSDNGSIIKCIITSKYLMDLCKEIGRGAENKEIPGYILNLPKEYLEVFLEGYMSGDGGYNKGCYYAVSVSEKLIYGIANIVTKLYNTPYTLLKVETKDRTKIEGRIVKQKDYYRLTYRKEDIEGQHGYYEDGMLWMPIRSLEYKEDFQENVYNFEVEEDNSYVANNIVVHNCQSFSISGNRLGLKDARGTLFFEIARIAKEKQPNVIFLENVKGLLSDDNGKTMHLILKTLNEIGYVVDFKLINSRNHGVAQSRERVYIFGVRKDLQSHRGWVIRGNTVEGRTKRELAKDKTLEMFNFKLLPNDRENKKIKDILEEDVDERFYVKKDKLERLMKDLEDKGFGNEKESKSKPRQLFKRNIKKGKDYKLDKAGYIDPEGYDTTNRVYTVNGLAPTITASCGGETHIMVEKEGERRVRRLTPLECLRLQAFPDEFYDILSKNGISNTQIYKQSGNAVTVTVIEDIMKSFIHQGYLDV